MHTSWSMRMVRPSHVMALAGHFETHLRHVVQPTMQVERTTDACEDVADLLQNVVVKNG